MSWDQERHDEVRDRIAAASPGPWEGEGWIGRVDAPGGSIAYEVPEGDVPFIVHARQDLPAALDEIERLRADVGRLLIGLAEERDESEELRGRVARLRAELERRPLVDRPRYSGVANQHRIEGNIVNGIIYHHPGDGPRNEETTR